MPLINYSKLLRLIFFGFKLCFCSFCSSLLCFHSLPAIIILMERISTINFHPINLIILAQFKAFLIVLRSRKSFLFALLSRAVFDKYSVALRHPQMNYTLFTPSCVLSLRIYFFCETLGVTILNKINLIISHCCPFHPIN